MKQYFTKYLPVEGEIKSDDKIFFRDKLATQGAVEHVVYYEDLRNIVLSTKEQLDNRKRAKLYLCSKDIQIGDVLQIIKDGKWYASPVISQEDIDAEISLPCYKVIGEISPEATWVKEGDEFDKEEICKWESVINAPNGRVVPTFYTIKGPCGHFH